MNSFRIAILLVCLSAAFNLLNCVNHRYNSGEKIVLKLEALLRPKFQFHILSNKKEEDMRNFEV